MIPHDAERLHVLLGYACNNNCLFCMEEDRVTRAQRILEVPPDTVVDLMRRHAQEVADQRARTGDGRLREVMFTSGEPLLNRHFLRYVREAKALGYETIGVITNGRLFAYERYARKALAAGLNHVVVSVHGADAKHHDAQTRTHASYAQTILGLRTLARLKATHPLRLHTSTVVNRRNVDRLYDIWESLRGLHIDQHVFNVIQPVGRAEVHFDRLVARFTDVVAAFRGFLDRVGVAESRSYLLDVPWCVSESLPDQARGFVERYRYYEHEDGLDDALRFDEHTAAREERAPAGGDAAGGDAAGGDGAGDDDDAGDCALPGTTVAAEPPPGIERGADDESGETVTLPGRDGEGGGRRTELRRLTRRRLDETRKSKRDECRRCRHEPVCDGVWNVYLEAWGWDEFQPVTDRRAGPPGSGGGQRAGDEERNE